MESAKELDFGERPDSVERALEILHGNGFSDDSFGVEGSEPQSVVRVENWLLLTDSQGFMEAERFQTNSLAEAAFEREAGR